MAVLSRARAFVVNIARGYLALPDDWSRRLWLGDDFRKKLDVLAVLVAAYDYKLAMKSVPIALPSPPSPVALLPSPAISFESAAPVVNAPSLELVLELRFFAYQLDIDSLAPDDAADLAVERDWCDYWYSWHASQLDAS